MGKRTEEIFTCDTCKREASDGGTITIGGHPFAGWIEINVVGAGLSSALSIRKGDYHFCSLECLHLYDVYKDAVVVEKKLWRIFPGEWCPTCDTPILIKTEGSLDDGFGYSGDKIQCVHCDRTATFRPENVGDSVVWDLEGVVEPKKITMKEKYIDEAVGLYIIFGEREDGTVDVSSGPNDVFEGIPADKAKRIVNAQEVFRKTLYSIFNR